jgi:energy-coupling factor transporter ATP-binding protein EcfA2
MAYEYSELLAQAKSWAESAHQRGYLTARAARELSDLDGAGPEQLFSADDLASRPLIVAFIGGSGVGKSSLLNRLAGQVIAKAGVERPTSREVTLFHHRACHLSALPANLPLDKTRISQHEQDASRHIIWIDMPDFDSVELANKALVFEWLPHIDALIYVVSPERYRDNKAWQLLKAEGCKHAWLFVMNQWDRAVPAQFDDFKHQLLQAGFDDPVVLYTSCSEPENDRFTELLAHLDALSSQQNMRLVSQHNERQRLVALTKVLQRYLQDLEQQDFTALRQLVGESWGKVEDTLQAGMAWTFTAYAADIAGSRDRRPEQTLWDDWAHTRVSDALELCLQAADQRHVSPKALRPGLDGVKAWIKQHATQELELSARQAMSRPGNAVQRSLLRLAAVCEVLLPLLAMSTVAYLVFAGYYHSAAESTAYLGVDFAVHSILLIGLSWLIPFFLRKKLQPSLEKAAVAGLKRGLSSLLAQAKSAIDQSVLEAESGQQDCLQTLSVLTKRVPAYGGEEARGNELLKRVLLDR